MYNIQMEKELDNSSFIDDYNKKLQSNNKRDIPKTSSNKQEEKTINNLSTNYANSAIIIDTSNVNLKKNKKSKKNVEISSAKKIKNNLTQTQNDQDIFELIKNNNNDSDSSVAFLGKKVKNLFDQNNNNSSGKIPNDENDNNNGVLYIKKGKFQDKNRNRKEQVIKTNNINNNNINICEKIEKINNNNNNKNIDIHNYNNNENYKLYKIDEVELLHQTEEYKSTLYFIFNEENRKMESKFISNYYS